MKSWVSVRFHSLWFSYRQISWYLIKITFICKKRFYKIPKIFVSRNSIFSDAIKCFFSSKIHIYFAVFCKEPRPLSMGFCKTYCAIYIMHILIFLALFSLKGTWLTLMDFFLKGVWFYAVLENYLVKKE